MLNPLRIVSLSITEALLLVLSILWVGDAYSGEWLSQPADVGKIEVQPNGRVYFQILVVPVPNLGCEYHADGLMELDTAAPHYKEQFALISMAKMTGKKVWVHVNGCGAYVLAQNTVLE